MCTEHQKHNLHHFSMEENDKLCLFFFFYNLDPRNKYVVVKIRKGLPMDSVESEFWVLGAMFYILMCTAILYQ